MANEKRLIDAEQAKRATYEEIFWTESEQAVVRNFLAKLPKVDAVEVVHGHWTSTDVIIHKAGYGVRYYYHAECKVNPHRLFECENDYCPNCGAKMDGERKDNGD